MKGIAAIPSSAVRDGEVASSATDTFSSFQEITKSLVSYTAMFPKLGRCPVHRLFKRAGVWHRRLQPYFVATSAKGFVR